METEPSRLHNITPMEITARRGTVTYRTGANICWLSGRRVCGDEKRVVKCVEICEACARERQNWFALRQLMCTMRVSVHQSEDGDVQRVPKLSHHQPAVHIWHAFTLIDTNTPVVYTEQ